MTDAVALGRRAVACKAWRWETAEGARLIDREGHVVGRVRSYLAESGDGPMIWIEPGEAVHAESVFPDLRDPATLGCLLALVREARGDPYLSPYFDDEITSQGCWCIDGRHRSRVARGRARGGAVG